MRSLFHSLRWRLQAWHGLLLLLVVAGSTVPAYRLALDNQTQRIDKELNQIERHLFRSMLDVIQSRHDASGEVLAPTKKLFFDPADFVKRLTAEPLILPESALQPFQGKEPGYSYFSVLDGNDKVIAQSENAPSDINFLPLPEDEPKEETRSAGSRRELARSTPHGLKMVIGRDISPELHDMQGIAWLHLFIGLGVWAFGLLGGWWLSGRAIRPIQTISQTAARIAEGNLEERIDVTAMDKELGELSQVLNQTFERLHAAFERQRQFTADASHELRTPITILLSETQRLLKRERTAEEYREALETCGVTAQRMRKLVEALLMLARQENHKDQEHYEPCDLAVILQDAAQHLSPLAQDKGRQITADLLKAPCQGDAAALTILVTNLISNALQHGGNVALRSGLRDGKAYFLVSDDGLGIASADLPHIFERFYRADQARTGSSGHSGLGLAIAKAIVDNHGASIQVTSPPGQGACFEVEFPA
jgi:two-component system OmpR family sensor kinase